MATPQEPQSATKPLVIHIEKTPPPRSLKTDESQAPATEPTDPHGTTDRAEDSPAKDGLKGASGENQERQPQRAPAVVAPAGGRDAPAGAPDWQALRRQSVATSTSIWAAPANFESYAEARTSGLPTLLIFSGPDDLCPFCRIFHETAEPEMAPRINSRFDGRAIRDDSYGRSPLAKMFRVGRAPYFVVMGSGRVRRVPNDIDSTRLADRLIAEADALTPEGKR